MIPGSEIRLKGRTIEWVVVMEIHFEQGSPQGPVLDLHTVHGRDKSSLISAALAMVQQGQVLFISKEVKDFLPLVFTWTMLGTQHNMVQRDPIPFSNLFFIWFKCRFEHNDCLEMVLLDPLLELCFPGLARPVKLPCHDCVKILLDLEIPSKIDGNAQQQATSKLHLPVLEQMYHTCLILRECVIPSGSM
jgi:hypothetical protein